MLENIVLLIVLSLTSMGLWYAGITQPDAMGALWFAIGITLYLIMASFEAYSTPNKKLGEKPEAGQALIIMAVLGPITLAFLLLILIPDEYRGPK